MEYNQFLQYHQQYGTEKSDILERSGYHDVLSNVVIAPWWEVNVFESTHKIIKINDNVFNVYGANYEFTFIALKAIGAPIIMDTMMHLGVTKCTNVIFIGSAGALCEELSIGDIVIPQASICGEGVSRYLNHDLADDFGKSFYPDKTSFNLIESLASDICIERKVNFSKAVNYTVDSIFLQFAHIEYIKKMGAKTIEMETSAFFKAANVIGVKAAAIFMISDNSVSKAGLYSGRNEYDKVKRNYVKKEIVPEIISRFFQKI